MKVSVITVTYNSLEALRSTANSVLSQTFGDFEYIIVDGASSDGTREYLESLANERLHWISEPDGGIYEAMNKGTRMSQGEYCIYMNAGDRFISDSVLIRISSCLDGTDLVLGNQILLDESGKIAGYTPSLGAITVKNLFQSALSHQSSFIKRSILLENPYDESLRLVSDWKFFLELIVGGSISVKEVNIDVCLFRAGGATDKNKALGAAERKTVLASYPAYKDIWQEPYNPSFVSKVWNKLLYYVKKLQYADIQDA